MFRNINSPQGNVFQRLVLNKDAEWHKMPALCLRWKLQIRGSCIYLICWVFICGAQRPAGCIFKHSRSVICTAHTQQNTGTKYTVYVWVHFSSVTQQGLQMLLRIQVTYRKFNLHTCISSLAGSRGSLLDQLLWTCLTKLIVKHSLLLFFIHPSIFY